VDVVAEEVAVQERSAAVRFMNNSMDASFCDFAAEDFAMMHSISRDTLRQLPTAPIDERVAGDDQPGHASAAAADQFARFDQRAIGLAEARPRQNVGQHGSHRAGGVRAERDSAAIQAVVRDGQPVASASVEQIVFRNFEFLKRRPLLYEC